MVYCHKRSLSCHPAVADHVVGLGADAAAAELRGHHELALALGLHGQQAVPRRGR